MCGDFPECVNTDSDEAASDIEDSSDEITDMSDSSYHASDLSSLSSDESSESEIMPKKKNITYNVNKRMRNVSGILPQKRKQKMRNVSKKMRKIEVDGSIPAFDFEGDDDNNSIEDINPSMSYQVTFFAA